MAASFDGIDDYIQIDDPDGNLSGFNSYTFSFWIKTNFQELNWGLFSVISKKQSFDFRANVYGGGHGYQFYTFEESNSIQNPTTSEWQNITVIQSNYGRKVYLNGILLEFLQNQNDQILFSTQPMNIGAEDFFDIKRWHYKGLIDDFRIYNRALSNAEVETLNGIAPQPIDGNKLLIAHYKMDGNAYDASGNSNHGTAHNGLSYDTDRFGSIGKAASFDGIDDFINVNHINSGKKFTLNFWMKNIEECQVILSSSECPFRQLFFGENSNDGHISTNITTGLLNNETFGEKSQLFFDLRNNSTHEGLDYYDFPLDRWNMFTFI